MHLKPLKPRACSHLKPTKLSLRKLSQIYICLAVRHDPSVWNETFRMDESAHSSVESLRRTRHSLPMVEIVHNIPPTSAGLTLRSVMGFDMAKNGKKALLREIFLRKE